VIDEERVAGAGLDGHGDAVPVMRAEREDPEDEQVERALKEGTAGGGIVSGSHSTPVSGF
jgi:hypothetical protein